MTLAGTPAERAAGRFPALFEPGRVGGLRLKNRVLMAPMEKNLCSANGVVSQRYIEYLVERARGDVALLRLEATYIDPAGKGRPFQAGAHTAEIVPGLARLVAAVHDAGGRISIELAHCGRQTNSVVTGRQPVAPSAVPCVASGGFMPRALTVAEIAGVVEQFAQAASRAEAAGVDAIEIHGASGYLINAFMSPYTNLREDRYGGSLENRMRFALEVVGAVREAVDPGLPVLYRMSADDFVPGGVTTTDTGPLAQALQAAGVDLIDVSAGTYESILTTQPPMEADPGGLISLAAEIKGQVSVPVAVAGKLGHLDVADDAVASGRVDFVTIGRGLHADPELLTKARSGRLDEVRMCIACAECVDLLGRDQVAACAVNPATTRERALRPRLAAVRKRVLVVGGGPAGMEAARAARLRGHSVRLLERSDRLGGQARLGALADGRFAFAEPVRFLEREMRRLGVAVTCGVEVDGRMVADISPEATILAVGATPAIPRIPGSELPHVITSLDYLGWEEHVRTVPALSHDSPWPAGAESAVVIGASWEGCHVADLLLHARLKVRIVEIRPTLGYDIGQQPGAVLRQRILEHPRTAGIHLQSTVEAITADHVTVWDTQTRELTALRADVVVLVAGREPNHDLATAINQAEAPLELAGVWPHEIIEVGDGVTPRKLQDALLEGAFAGSRV